jgi:signal transduction histidine kinase
VHETLSLLGASLQHHAIKVVVDSSADVTVFGFPSQFTQVLLNLMGNARDAILNHAPVQGGVITLAWSSKADQLQLTVADNGGGIPEDILAKIFEPYFSTKPQGSGIGLYMSKLIIEHNMHGQLRAANQTDGAVFTILLPLDEPSE